MNKKKGFIFCGLSILLVSQVLHAEDIDELLSKYEESADMSNKTKIESLGHYIVLTRKDIEMMQAYTLSDVLRSLKFHTHLPNRFGVYQPTLAGQPPSINTSYRLFLDDHEVSSIHTDNPFLMFDNYPLDGINHIEIYYGAGAIRLGNEPSLMVIKLYTKEPSRENVRLIRLSGSTRRDHVFSFSDARVIKPNISYNLMVNRSVFDFKPNQVGEKLISRDTTGNYLFFKLRYYDTTLDFSYIKVKRDTYGSIAVDFSPDISKSTSEDVYVNLTQNLLADKSLKINLSVDLNSRKGEFLNRLQEGGVFIGWLYPSPPNPAKIPFYYYEDRNINKYSFYVAKEFKTEENTLLIGGSYKVKENNVTTVSYTTLSGSEQRSEITPLTRINLSTVFIENQYNINQKNLLFASLKYDYHKRNGGYSDISEYIARVGFVSFLSENVYLKSFLTRTYLPPSLFEVEMSNNPTKLKPEKITGGSFEFGYNMDRQSLNIFYGYLYIKDMISLTPYTQNLQKYLTAHNVLLNYKYRFDVNTKLLLNIYKSFNNHEDFSSTEGGSIKIYTSTDSFDVYNELVYRKGFKVYGKDVNSSLNYNIALKYKVNRGLVFGLRGENLLNSSAKSVFTTAGDTLILPSFDRKLIVSIEKVF